MKRLFQNLFAGPKTCRARDRRARLGMEALEGRDLMSVTAALSGGVLQIDCPDSNVNVVVLDRVGPAPSGSGSTGFLEVLANGQQVPLASGNAPNGFALSFSWIGNYDIRATLHGNNDTFRYQIADGFDYKDSGQQHRIDVDLGSGDNTKALFDFRDTNGRVKTIGQGLVINVTGSGGRETCEVDLGNVTNTFVSVTDSKGAAKNTFICKDWGQIVNSTMNVTLGHGLGLANGSVQLGDIKANSHVSVNANLSDGIGVAPDQAVNTFFFRQSGVVGDSTLDVTVNGSPVRDGMDTQLGSVQNSTVNVTANLGAGTDNDWFTNLLNGNLDNHARVNVKATGADFMWVGSGFTDGPVANHILNRIDATSCLNYTLRAGHDVDAITADMYLTLNGKLTMDVTGGDGYFPAPVGKPKAGGPNQSWLLAHPWLLPHDTTNVQIKTTSDSTGHLDVTLDEHLLPNYNELRLGLYLGGGVTVDRARVNGGGRGAAWLHGREFSVINCARVNQF
jgi:hypothetical protein